MRTIMRDGGTSLYVPEATLQDFKNVMDKTYVPSSGTETELFNLQNKLFYSILSTVLKTKKSLDIIRRPKVAALASCVWAKNGFQGVKMGPPLGAINLKFQQKQLLLWLKHSCWKIV